MSHETTDQRIKQIEVNGEEFAIYAVYDGPNIDYYDVYNGSGECVNLGQPFYTMPTPQDICDLYGWELERPQAKPGEKADTVQMAIKYGWDGGSKGEYFDTTQKQPNSDPTPEVADYYEEAANYLINNVDLPPVHQWKFNWTTEVVPIVIRPKIALDDDIPL